MAKTIKDRILKMLIDAQKLTKKQMSEAIALQKKKKISLDKALIEKGHIKEQDLMAILVRELNIPFINLSKYKIDPALQEIVSERVARQYHIVPLSALENSITIALSDPLNVFAMDDIRKASNLDVTAVVSSENSIQN